MPDSPEKGAPGSKGKDKKRKYGARRRGREAALQLLFGRDCEGAEPDAGGAARFWDIHDAKPDAREVAEMLIAGVVKHQDELDKEIAGSVENYTFERIARVDRNVLRVALFELRHTDTPHPVVIDEAIEIASRYGNTDSGKFVNGLLDALAKITPS